jgi:uncharacterized membrane protein
VILTRLRANPSVAIPDQERPVARSRKHRVIAVSRAWSRLLAFIAAVVAMFLIVGHDSLASSSRSVLHGLCAQRPSHSFMIGGELLPFDARMTGIYTGALLTWIILGIRGRMLAYGTPALPVILVLAGGVVAIAIDGVNALLVDLGAWHPYGPMNALRLLTGFGAGVSLVTLEAWLLGSTVWKIGSKTAPWAGPRDLAWTVPSAALTLAVVTAGPGWIYPLLVFAQLASAWITVAGLCLVIVVSIFRLDRRITSLARLETPLIASAAAALLIILALAQLRFWLERSMGIPQDFVAVVARPLATIL